ncbi:tetratricopeptide repeat protein [Nostoc sp. WHI]|uniref:tetratricopeptide repeat protein n=1 Tax=Nostoc sp. WHI TaxID=2650611 RepID=UPI002EDB612A|nr:tetratricopeptide repeat protein [Nostoc sp. WHI]
MAFYEQALVIRKELKDRTQEATTLNNIGLSYSNLSQYPKALEYYQQALAIRQQIGDRSGENWRNLRQCRTVLQSFGVLSASFSY